MSFDQALVLGGGGVAGIAWMTGLLAGLADAGQDVSRGADLLIGTSAGATVAAQVGSGTPLDDLYARQHDPDRQTAEIPADIDAGGFAAQWQEFIANASTPQETLLAVGKLALAAVTVPEARRRAVIASRLPSAEWPARAIRLVAVDCESAATVQFSADSGVSLVDAVAASCAVPGIWPAVTIGGRRYMDGGVRSPDNADLAAGAARVVIVSPFGTSSELPSPMPLPGVIAELRAAGSQVTVIEPDGPSRDAMGANPLDPATRTPAAAAGRDQGRQGLPRR
jgi:NTE family protein